VDKEKFISERGVDSYCFLRLLMTAAKVFLVLTATIGAFLLPLDLTAGSRAEVSGLDRLSWSNVQIGQNGRYWGHLVAVLVVIAYVCYVLVSEFRELIRIRQSYSLDSCRGPHQLASMVLITDIPKEKLDEDKLARDYARFNGGPVNIWINRDVASLTQTIKERNRLVCKLEAVLAEESQQERKVWFRRFRTDDNRMAAMSIAEHIHGLNKKITEQKEGFQKLEKLPSAFLQFADPVTAHLVQQTVVHPVPLSMVPHAIAQDDDIIWSNLSLHWWQRLGQKVIVLGLVTGLAVLWVVPMAGTGLLSQIAYLDTKVPWVRTVLGTARGRMLLGLIQGLVPQLMLSILMVLFPEILVMLVRRQGQLTQSAMELSLQGHYFTFLYLQVFLVVSISTSITTTIPEVLDNLASVPSILATNIPKASDYFYSYLLQQAVTQCAISLRQIPNSLWRWLLTRIRILTPRDEWDFRKGRSMMRWGLVYPVFTNLACICKFEFFPETSLLTRRY
jgi:hypothetical protein